MHTRWDEIDVDGARMRGYVAEPDSARDAPAVIVIQHAGGVDEFIRRMTERTCEAGYLAVSPDLYHRDDPKTSDDPMTRMGRLRDRNIVTDVNAAIAYAQSMTSGPVGVTGFCMGGRVTYLMAAQSDVIRAAVAFYAGNIMTPWGEGRSPFDLTDRISCPLLGLFGEDDRNPTPADVQKIDAEMTRLGKPHEFHNYPGAGHAFMDEDRQSYRAEAATDAWRRCIGWFDQHLKRRA